MKIIEKIQRKKQQIQDSYQGMLKHFCEEIPPQRRLLVVLAALAVFTLINIGITVQGISNIGRKATEPKALQIEPIQKLDYKLKSPTFKHPQADE